jgi:plastocyanin
MTAVKGWRFFGVGMLAVAAALLAGSWSLHDTASPARAQGANTVQVGDDHFAPQTITVPVGTTVTWEVTGTHGHTVTSDTGVFDSGSTPLKQGDTFSFTFNQVGTFPYFCMFHGGPGDVGMSGTVVVTAAQGQQPTPAPTAMPAAAPTPMPAAAPTPAAMPTPPAPSGATTGNSITVTLGPGRDGSQPGTAMLTAMGSQTEVDISIAPGAAGVPQPVHIHAGTCDNLGAVVYPLTSIVDGKSMTLVNTSLSSLETGNFAINAHLSQAGISTYVSCGTIPASTAAGQTSPATRLPAAGSAGLQGGYGGSGSTSTWWYVLAAAGAVLLLSGATILWGVRARR